MWISHVSRMTQAPGHADDHEGKEGLMHES